MSAFDQPLQPPDPEDLRRYPPAEASCLRVRGLIRDHSDGDLGPALRAAVDLHVHGCRTCALALSRAEHEVWRLRRALADSSTSVPAGLPGRTVERLLRELSREATAPAVTAELAPAAILPPVRPPRQGRTGTARRLAGYAAIAGATLAAMCLLLWRGYAEVDGTARVVVVAAEHARFGRGTHLLPVAPGDVLVEGAVLIVDAGGHAEIEWNDAGTQRQPAATQQLQGGAQVQMVDAKPVLAAGAVEVDSQRQLAITIPDGTVVELGNGVYHFDVVDYRSFDAALREERSDLRVRVEAQSGTAARIVRAAGDARLAAGQVAQWHGWSATTVERLPSASALSLGIGAASDQVPTAPMPPALVGSVLVEPAGTPSVGSGVLLWFLERGLRGVGTAETDAAGIFRIPSDRSVEGEFVVAQLFPPSGRSDLGLRAPEAYPVLRTTQGLRLQDALVLEPTTDMGGSVTDREQRQIAGVQVVPCVVDELFGLLLPWVEGRVTTDARGNFTLRGLPTALPAQQHLELLLLHANFGARCEPVPLPNSWAFRAMRPAFSLPPLVPCNVSFPDLRSQRIELIEELMDVPPGAAVRRHAVATDAQGRPQQPLQTGGGRLWLRAGSPARPTLRAITREGPGPQASWAVGETARAQAAVLRSLEQVPGTDYQLAHEYRHQRFRAPGGDRWLLSAVEDVTGRAAPQAQLFAVGTGPLPTPRFLGIYDGHLGVGASLGEDGSVLALDALGQVGTEPLVPMPEHVSANAAGNRAGGRLTVHLASTGRLVLATTLRPSPTDPQQVVTLRLLPREGLLAGSLASFVRFATAADGWTIAAIVPGTYQVQGIGTNPLWVTVPPGEVVMLR